MPRKHLPHSLALAASLALLATAPAHAVSVIGNLANFDAVNNTGKSAYGFEIELEDPELWNDSRNASLNNSSKYVYSVFGLDRNFGGNLGTQVTRFGTAVSVENYSVNNQHAGVRITYGFASGLTLTPDQFAAAAAAKAITPINNSGFNSPGESCWPGNATWSTANPCDHFGVSTTGNPVATRYSWIVQASPNSPVLAKELLAIPAVVYQVPPPVVVPPAAGGAPVQRQPVVARIEAVELEPRRDARDWGTAVWVKTFTTVTKQGDINLGNLLIDRDGNGGDADLKAKIDRVDIEWNLLQSRPKSPDNNDPVEAEAQENLLELDDDSKSFIRRYEFYQYIGGYDTDHRNRAFCDSECEKNPLNYRDKKGNLVPMVGDFLGRQIAGFNADPQNLPVAPAVPEPQTWAMFAAGLLAIGGLRRRQRG